MNLTLKKVSLKLKMRTIFTNLTRNKKWAGRVSFSLQLHEHKRKNHNFIDRC